jgi:RHS repeat-associated protein
MAFSPLRSWAILYLGVLLFATNASGQSCDYSLANVPISLTFEPVLKDGTQVTAEIGAKNCGAPEYSATGMMSFFTPGSQLAWVNANPCLDLKAGAFGHCPAPWVGGAIGMYAIDNCPFGWGSFNYTLIPCSREPGCRACPNAGKPVNITSGNVWFDHTDATIPNLVFTRSYNSRIAFLNLSGAFGRGWTHSFEKEIQSASATVQTANMMLIQGDGMPIYYKPSGDGTLRAIAPGTERSWLVPGPGGTYTRYIYEGGSEAYDSNGKLVTINPPAGPTVTLTRDSSLRIASISDGARTLTLDYDTSSRVSSLSGPGGLIASYTYSASGLLETASYPDGSGYRYAYDGAGGALSVTDFTGRVLERHTYDSSGRGLTSETDEGKEKLTFDYSYPPVTRVTDALGNVSAYEYRPFSHVALVTELAGTCQSCGGDSSDRQSWTYDAAGHVTSHTTRSGVTQYTYDTAGNRLTENDNLDHITTYTYDGQGRVLTATRPDGGVTTYTYAAAGPLTVTEKVTSSLNRTTTIAYNGQGLPGTITDPRGKVTTLGYNASRDLTSVTDPLTHATTFGYDALGRRTTVTDALSHATTTTYDARGRVTRLTNHDGTHTDFTYDLGGRRTSVTDPLGRATTYDYDPFGRLDAVVDPIGGATRYGYDSNSNLVSLTDAKGQTTNFEYDSYTRVSRVVYPGGAFEIFNYDQAGRLETKVDRKSVTTTYAYDADNRLTGKTYSDGTPAATYTYDTVGRLLTAANGTDTLTWTYDLAGQLLTEQSTKNASTVAYTYDTGGNRATISLDGTLFLTYGYDDASRLTTITKGSSVFGLGYDNANRRTSMTYPNGITTAYTYDNLNRLTRLKADLSATPITDFQYVYDNAGNRTRKQQLDYTEDYTYDPLYRLTGATRSAGGTGLWQWAYDQVGNRTSAQLDNTVATSTYNEKNQLVSSSGGGPLRWRGTLNEPGNVSFTSALVNGKPAKMLQGNIFEAMLDMVSGNNNVTVQATDVSGNVTTKNYQVSVSGSGATYTYDANGNLSQKVEGPDTWGYEWNPENQLTRVTKNSVEQARFKYDPLARRLEKVVGGTTTSWTYQGQDIFREVRGSTTLKYIHGPSIDEPIAYDDGSGLSYFHADGLGSLGKTTSASGAVTLSRRYDAWGGIELGAPTSGFAFTGREHDPESGLAFYRARYYDPRNARFISEDPITFRGGLNFYAYAGNNPSLNTDPMGLLTCVKWSDGTITCVEDPSLCLRMGACSPWPPKCPNGFVYYGNWGGPGWTGGQCGSWNSIDPTKAHPPIDNQDKAYCGHDRCYGGCANLPTSWQRFMCRVGCDQNLTRDLFHVVFSSGPNAYALAGIAAFSNSGGAISGAIDDKPDSGANKANCCASGGGSK